MGDRLYLSLWVPSKTAFAVGDRSILTSGDGARRGAPGRSSSRPTSGESLATDPIWYDVMFPDPNGWIVGEFGKIMHTTDGGETWHEQEKTLMSKDGVQVYMDVLDLPTLYGVQMKNAQEGLASGLEGHIARTRDGGQTWAFEPMEVEYPIADPLFRVVELPDQAGWGVGAAGEVVHKAPTETAWKRANLGQDVLTWLRGINFSDAQHGWLVGGFGLIYRTTDGGKRPAAVAGRQGGTPHDQLNTSEQEKRAPHWPGERLIITATPSWSSSSSSRGVRVDVQPKLETSFVTLPAEPSLVQIHNKYAGTFGGANNRR